MVPKAYEDITRLVTGTVRTFEPMHKHTSWRIGGPAEIFVRPASTDDLQKIFTYARDKGLKVTVIGNGTNILVSDRGIRGIVIQIGKGMDHLVLNNKHITAGAGVKLSRLAAFAREHELQGFEFLAGIPGTVGGALVMNAGANNFCIAEFVHEVITIDNPGNLKKYARGELNFGYRTSEIREKGETVVEATFEGTPGQKEIIKKITEEYLEKRKKSQPLEYPNAGSVFKNPPGDSAGRLIEMAGGKGLAVGDARVSTKHANFFLNCGHATARDMLTLIKRVQSLVQDKYGIKLSLEVQLVGEH